MWGAGPLFSHLLASAFLPNCCHLHLLTRQMDDSTIWPTDLPVTKWKGSDTTSLFFTEAMDLDFHNDSLQKCFCFLKQSRRKTQIFLRQFFHNLITDPEYQLQVKLLSQSSFGGTFQNCFRVPPYPARTPTEEPTTFPPFPRVQSLFLAAPTCSSGLPGTPHYNTRPVLTFPALYQPRCPRLSPSMQVHSDPQ